MQILYDYKFEDIWTTPEKYMETLKKYRAVLTPDFSMYLEMHPVLQLYNTFRNRWIGAYLANQKIKVIPTVNWGDESTFDFCFEGIEKGSAVAVSTYMASAHDNRKDQKEWFLKGYNEMLRRIEPSVIICYHTPFPEMTGNIVFVDYDLSSWKHEDDDLEKTHEAASCEKTRIVKRTGRVIFGDFSHSKGGGSAYGGEWQQSKAGDDRYLGNPGDIINSNAGRDGNGYERDTLIGEDGRAAAERHYSDHGNPKEHSEIHDHLIFWDPNRGTPDPQPPINYFESVPYLGDILGSIIGKTKEKSAMAYIHREYTYDPEEYRFKTISEFKWCVLRGAEIGFTWNDRNYHVCSKVPPSPGADPMILFYEDYKEDTEQWFQTPDEVLECLVDGTRLREIITQVEVTDRTI